MAYLETCIIDLKEEEKNELCKLIVSSISGDDKMRNIIMMYIEMNMVTIKEKRSPRTSLLVVPAWCPYPCHPPSLMSFTTSCTSSSIHMSSSPPAHHPQHVTFSSRVHPPYVWVQLEIACETPVFSVLHSSYFSLAPMNSLLWGIPSTSPDIVALLCASWSLGLLQLHIQLLLVSLLVVEVLAFVVWRMLVVGQGVGGLY